MSESGFLGLGPVASGALADGDAVDTGTLSATLGGLTLSATGALTISGSLGATLGELSLSATGQLPIAGTLTRTLGGLSLSATGTLPIAASATVTLAALAVSATASLVTVRQRIPHIPPIPTQVAPGQERNLLRIVAERSNLVLRGKMNAVATVTLTPGATSTVLTDERIGIFSTVNLQATSATAAAAVGLWVEKAQGSATIHHDNTADLDRTFSCLIIG